MDVMFLEQGGTGEVKALTCLMSSILENFE